MREDLLNELTAEYEALRMRNEQEEVARREKIRREHPEIEKLLEAREELIFGTIHRILDGNAGGGNLPKKMDELNGDIAEALQKAGFPANYLEPIYRCPKCRDTGYRGEVIREPCECLAQAYARKLRDRIGLGKDGKETFEKFDASLIPDDMISGTGITQRKLSVFAREQCEKWADSYPKAAARDVLLTGGTGLGKTFLMRAMAARLIERGQNVLILSAYTFLQMARKSYFESDNGVRELMEVPVLMMDDLGSEPLMQNITVEQLFYLLNERQTRGLSTVISTNLTLQELRERYTERIASRLNNPKNCLIITLAGKDLRTLEKGSRR